MKKMLTVCALMFAAATAMAAPSRYPAKASAAGANEVTAGLGFTKGAINLGAEYEKRSEALGWGGYFFLQTDKEKSGAKIVNQVMSFGGQAKIHLVDNGFVDAFMAPGFGLHMIKDVADPSSTSGKTDVTAFGPTLRLGVLVPLTPAMKLGLSHLELWNWFDEKAASSVEYYQAALAFDF